MNSCNKAILLLVNLSANQKMGEAAMRPEIKHAPVMAKSIPLVLITRYLKGRIKAMYFSAVINSTWKAAVMATKLCETSTVQTKAKYVVLCSGTTGIKTASERIIFKDPFKKSQIAKLKRR